MKEPHAPPSPHPHGILGLFTPHNGLSTPPPGAHAQDVFSVHVAVSTSNKKGRSTTQWVQQPSPMHNNRGGLHITLHSTTHTHRHAQGEPAGPHVLPTLQPRRRRCYARPCHAAGHWLVGRCSKVPHAQAAQGPETASDQ